MSATVAAIAADAQAGRPLVAERQRANGDMIGAIRKRGDATSGAVDGSITTKAFATKIAAGPERTGAEARAAETAGAAPVARTA